MSEPQRVQAVLIANQRGGDGEPIILDVSPSTFVDVAQNPNLKNIMLILEEFPDDIPPRILKCSIDYNVGNLFIFTNEIIDVTPSVLLNLSLISLVQSNTSTDEVTLFGAKTTAIDSQILTIKLTESQRVLGIQMSGTPGGDGSTAFLRFHESALLDFSLLGNDFVAGSR